MKPGDLVRLSEKNLSILGNRFDKGRNAFIVLNIKPLRWGGDHSGFGQNIEVLGPDGSILILGQFLFEAIDEAG